MIQESRCPRTMNFKIHADTFLFTVINHTLSLSTYGQEFWVQKLLLIIKVKSPSEVSKFMWPSLQLPVICVILIWKRTYMVARSLADKIKCICDVQHFRVCLVIIFSWLEDNSMKTKNKYTALTILLSNIYFSDTKSN